ncbi:hypothetical protein BRD17_10190 [Halobacteriales archaeon SW_7_68_16]|nr:MAG: hypothetical protein BRD17_10190 [Halobacteriales archaeon SW_7_68_16]
MSPTRGPGPSSRGDGRGQSPLIGIVLIIGFVLIAALGTIGFATFAVSDVRDAASVEDAVQSMREVDSRLTQVIYSSTDVQRLQFGAERNQRTRIDAGSSMRLTLNDDPACSVRFEMGTIEQIVESSDGDTVVAYEGGGIWTDTRSGTAMVSPPTLEYNNGTVDFPFVSVSGTLSGRVGEVLAEKNRTLTRQRNARIRRTFNDPACQPADSLSITATSDYYRAWGRYFERETPGNVAYDEDTESATVRLSKVGAGEAAFTSSGNVSGDSEFVADIDFLAGEASVERDDWSANGDDVLNDPLFFRIVRDGSRTTPWTDVDDTDPLEVMDDDVNRPSVESELPLETRVRGQNNTSLTIELVFVPCGSGQGHDDQSKWTDTGIDRTFNGTSYDQWQCKDDSLDTSDARYVISSAEETNEDRVKALTDGDEVNDAGGDLAEPYQRSLETILQDKYYPSNSTLDLPPNQVIYVFDISPGDLSDADFNDAVALVTLREPGNVGTETEFSVRVSVDTVRIER